MKILYYIFLGILQGITEPIPVSSSGHVLIFKTLFKRLTSGFTVDYETLATITNFGSLIAIIIIYRKEIIRLLKSFFKYIGGKKDKSTKSDYSYALKIIIATIPAGLLGIVFVKLNVLDKLENNIKFIGVMLLITALFLYLIKDFKGKKEKDNITYLDALIIGLSQMVSIIPGISRSGATIVGSMYRDLKREVAFNFSFIMYIPISIATSILGIKDLLSLNLSFGLFLLYIIAFILAFIFTYIFTKWFAKIVKEGKLIYFSIYCLIIGLCVIIFM